VDLDLRLLRLARTRGHWRSLERAVNAYSRLGEHGAGWIALGLLGAMRDPRRRTRWLRGARIVAVSYGLNQVVKFIVRRPRPELPGLPPLSRTITQLSFPSAHTTTAFAGARAYSGLLPTQPLYAAALITALSRPYLGVHYPSDVLAGAALGTLTAEVWAP
jgi:membrane-associated phospholipid phosphatase